MSEMQAKQEDFRDYRRVHKPPKVRVYNCALSVLIIKVCFCTPLSSIYTVNIRLIVFLGPREMSAGDQLQHSAN